DRGGVAAVFSQGTAHRSSFDTQFPVWGPKNRLAYASSDNGWLDIFVAGINSGDRPAQLFASESDKQPTDRSFDGRELAFMQLSRGGSYEQWALPLDSDRQPRPLLSRVASEGLGKYSPDGRYLLYVSTETGALQVWLRPTIGSGKGIKVSAGEGIDPSWI